MTPTIESLEKTGVLEKVAPTRDALLAESSEEMHALLRFCFSHINCGEIIDVTHGEDDDDAAAAAAAASVLALRLRCACSARVPLVIHLFLTQSSAYSKGSSSGHGPPRRGEG